MIFNLTLPTLISRIITLLLAFTFHEFAHAATATALGDMTAKNSGRLTLILATLPLRFGWVPLRSGTSFFLPSLGEFLLEFLSINLALFLFNLIPLAPLDGEKVITFFLPDHWVDFYDRIRPYSPFILLVILFVLPMFGLDLINIIIRQPLNSLVMFLIGRG